MSKQGLNTAIQYGESLEEFNNKIEAENYFMSYKNHLLERLKIISKQTNDFFLNYTEESLKEIEKWYFDLYEKQAFDKIGSSLEEFESILSIYWGAVIVENKDDTKWVIERVSRKIHQKKYVVNKIGYEQLYHLISLANVLHCDNPQKVVDDWIEEYKLKQGSFDIEDVDKELCTIIPTPLDMGKVYARLIIDTSLLNEDYVSGIIRVYNDEICETIDNYTNGAFFEPSYVLARAYKEGEF